MSGAYFEHRGARLYVDCERCGVQIVALNHGPHTVRAVAEMHSEACDALAAPSPSGTAKDAG